jgi:hypothetical protein
MLPEFVVRYIVPSDPALRALMDRLLRLFFYVLLCHIILVSGLFSGEADGSRGHLSVCLKISKTIFYCSPGNSTLTRQERVIILSQTSSDNTGSLSGWFLGR